MNFKKYLEIRLKGFFKGQSSLEYFILLLAIASLTLLSVSALVPKLQEKGENLFSKAVERIVK